MKLLDGLLVLRNQLKIYHWQTRSHSRHIGSNFMVDTLDGQIDRFVETIQGTRHRLKTEVPLELHNLDDKQIVPFVKKMMDWLTAFENHGIHETDLLNIRDEMLGTLRKGLYFFSQK